MKRIIAFIKRILTATPTPIEIKLTLGIVATISVSSFVIALGMTRFDVPELRNITGTKPHITAPASPGLTSAVEICKYGEVSRVPVTERGGYRYTGVFGLDVLQWPDDPPGRNHIGLINGEPVVLSAEVEKCLRNKF